LAFSISSWEGLALFFLLPPAIHDSLITETWDRALGMAIRGRVPATRRVPAPMELGMGLIFHPWVRGR
jgi:hypothetical protein